MFRVTRYPMISKTESGRVGYRNKYRVAGRVRVPAGHCLEPASQACGLAWILEPGGLVWSGIAWPFKLGLKFVASEHVLGELSITDIYP